MRQIARGSLLSGIGAVAAAFGGIALTLVVARSFSPELAGTFFASTAFFLIVSSLAQLGTDVGLVRYVASQAATGEQARLAETLRVALVPVVVVSAGCAALMYLQAPRVSDWIGNPVVNDDTTSILRVLALFVPLASLYGSLLAVTRGRGSMRVTVFVDSLFRTMAQPLLFGATVLFGWAPATAAVAWVLPYPVGVGVCTVVLWRRFRRTRTQTQGSRSGLDTRTHSRRGLAREFWSFTAARAVSGTVVMVWRRFDVLLVAAISGPADAAIYTAATRFLVVGSLGIQAVQMTVSPQLSRMFAQHDLAGARRIFTTSTMWTMTFAWPLYLVTASAVSLVIPIFGSHYSAGASSVVVLSASMLVATACGGVDAVLLMSGRSLLSLGNAVLTLTVNVGLDLLLIPQFGILGAATGWAISIALRNVLGLLQIHQMLQMWAFTRNSAAIAVVSVACFAVAPGLLSWADSPRVWLLVSLGAGAAAYLAWTYLWRANLQLDTFGAAVTRRSRTA